MRQLTSKEKWNIYHNACDWIRPTYDDISPEFREARLYTVKSFKKKYKINTSYANQLINKLLDEAKLIEIEDGVYKAKRKCTMCNKEFDQWDASENHYIYYRFGYGSMHDDEILEVDLCCDCYDGVVDFIASKSKNNPLTDCGLIPKEPF